MKKLNFIFVFILLFLYQDVSFAQYFGRNKPRYEKFDFKVYQSPNFEMYHYLTNDDIKKDIAKWAEQWYSMHQNALLDTFSQRNPLIVYNDHADFQQTNAVFGRMGVGTGGVTEALKNRVIIPIAFSNQQTMHVLGHELVHAFQYHMIINGDSTSMKNLGNLPLWMVEGLAEYMSIGRVDAHTAMWMRDAVMNDDIPEIKDLSNPKYFPYRYGQTFWSFLTGWKGDEIIKPFFLETAKVGFEEACLRVLEIDSDQLSELWVSSFKKHFSQYINTNKKEKLIGKRLFEEKKAGKINIAPVLSPNGKYVIFLSEKGVFSLDLYLADARTGEILKKVASASKSAHIDDFSFIESSGAWSPNSKKFVFVAVSKGDNILVIKDALSGKTVEEIKLDELPAFSNPAWSPDKKSIVVSGLVNGQTDLYQIFLKDKKVKQLTNDRFSELQPNWSQDGSKIVFASDRLSFGVNRSHGKWNFNISVLDVKSGKIEDIDVFHGADNLNPIYDNENNIIFLSDRDGFRNLYKYEVSTQKVYQQTDFQIGISGITNYAPAISTSTKAKRNRVLYTYYSKNGYSIYRAKSDQFLNREVPADSVDLKAAFLMKINKKAPELVEHKLDSMDYYTGYDDSQYNQIKYKPKFKLDYIGGGAGVGVGVSTGFGNVAGAAGGVDLMFSDILGHNQLFSSLYLNGEVFDFGGNITYSNSKNRVHWGASISHLPIRSGGYNYEGLDTLWYDNNAYTLAEHWSVYNIRIFEDKIGAFASFPFSTVFRVEGGASYSFYSNRVDQLDNFYDYYGRLIYQTKKKIDPKELGLDLFKGELINVYSAFVGDNSFFGIASPLKGYRFRIGAEKYLGSFDFYSLTADFRKYFYVNHFSIALRAMHYGRYGNDTNIFYPLFLGYPWYIRGYPYSKADEILRNNKLSIENLFGSKVMVGNVEIRIPFTGPKSISLFTSKFLFTELSFFLDAGVAYNDFDEIESELRVPVLSAGASLRVNVFGALILEPYYAYPLLKNSDWVLGLNFVPGW